MSRIALWIVSAFLTLAMIAMIILQAYWIKRSVSAEELQLNLLVGQVLNEVGDELVANQTVITILDEIQPPVVQNRGQEVWNYHIDQRSAYDRSEAAHENPHQGTPEESYVYTSPHQSLKNTKVKMLSDSLVVVIGEDEDGQDTVLVNAMKPDQIRVTLRQELEQGEALVNRVIRRMLVEEKELEQKLTATQVEMLISSRLAAQGIHMPYEYAVYDEGKPPFFSSASFNEYESLSYYRAPIFSESVFERSSYISLYFPGQQAYIRKSMGLMGGSSLIITLFIIAMFSLVMYIMFKQKRLSEIKNDFVNNMTHELKTPISTISLASQMLSDESIPNEQKNLKQISKIIRSESKQLGFQVERVLQMAIFDHGELKLKKEEIDIHDVIENVAQNFLLQLDRQGGKLDFLPEAETAVIKGDLMHITNVLSNLLENAMKYSKNKPEISISTRINGNFLMISISDKGIGIGREDQKRIFEKFYRVPSGNVHNVKGFGLGLSYVKLVVEAHGGSIDLKSEINQGSQFDIQLLLYEA